MSWSYTILPLGRSVFRYSQQCVKSNLPRQLTPFAVHSLAPATYRWQTIAVTTSPRMFAAIVMSFFQAVRTVSRLLHTYTPCPAVPLTGLMTIRFLGTCGFIG